MHVNNLHCWASVAHTDRAKIVFDWRMANGPATINGKLIKLEVFVLRFHVTLLRFAAVIQCDHDAQERIGITLSF